MRKAHRATAKTTQIATVLIASDNPGPISIMFILWLLLLVLIVVALTLIWRIQNAIRRNR